jgi:hypothetical protein
MGVLVYATPGALRRAERLMPGVVLENAVEAAIHAGRKRPFLPRGVAGPALAADERSVLLDGAVAIVKRSRARLSERRAWLVVRVMRAETGYRVRPEPATTRGE